MNGEITQQPILTEQPQLNGINDNILLEEFSKEIVKQGERLDDLTKTLFSAELTIPGLYAALLRLMNTDGLVMPCLIFTAVCWIAALSITLWNLYPKKYTVMSNSVVWHEKRTATDALFDDSRILSSQC